MKKIANVTVKSPFSESDEGQPIARLLRDMIPRFPAMNPRGEQMVTMDDSIKGLVVYQKCVAADGYIELEDAEHEWLEKAVDRFAPLLMGMNAAIIKNACKPVQEIMPEKKKD